MKILTLVISLVVGVILAGALLMPTLNDATATEKTYENLGYFNLERYTDNVTFSWNGSNPSSFIVNGEEIEYTNTSGLNQSVVLGQRFAVRVTATNTISYYGAGQYLTGDSITASLSNGTFSISNGTDTRTVSNVTEIYAISNDGPYVMKKSDSPAYLNSGSEIVADSEIYASGQTFSGYNFIFWHMAGTIDNLEYPNTFDDALTITNEQIHGEYSSICNDLYILNNITFVATSTIQEGITYNVTASYFVVPATVTAELTHHLTTEQIAIMGAIPIMVIVTLLMIAVNAIRRD